MWHFVWGLETNSSRITRPTYYLPLNGSKRQTRTRFVRGSGCFYRSVYIKGPDCSVGHCRKKREGVGGGGGGEGRETEIWKFMVSLYAIVSVRDVNFKAGPLS